MSQQVDLIARHAKTAFESSQLLDPSERIHALKLIKDELEGLKEDIIEANKADMQVCSGYMPPKLTS